MRHKPQQNPVPSSAQQPEREERRFVPRRGVNAPHQAADTASLPPPSPGRATPRCENRGTAHSTVTRPAEEPEPAQPGWARVPGTGRRSRRGPGRATSGAGCGLPGLPAAGWEPPKRREPRSGPAPPGGGSATLSLPGAGSEEERSPSPAAGASSAGSGCRRVAAPTLPVT